MSRIKRGWALSKKSWGLLNEHRQLLRFPLYGGIASTQLWVVTLAPRPGRLDLVRLCVA